MFQRIAVLLALLALSIPAFAQAPKVAVVDFQKALDSVQDGEAARAKLNSMMQQKQTQIETMETRLRAMKDEYDKQALILSDAARRQKEQEMMSLQSQYQQAYMQSEGEMQQLYVQLMEGLLTRMRKIAAEIGKEKGYDFVLEVNEGGIVYFAAAHDITAELIKRYNAGAGK
jgi:outer membrane protein